MIDIVKKIKDSAIQQAKRVITEKPKKETIEERMKSLEAQFKEIKKGN